MFLQRIRSLHHTLALRLTAWYAGIFAVSSSLAFGFVFMMVVSAIQERTDEELEDDVAEFAALWKMGGLDRVESEMMLESQDEGDQIFIRLWTPGGRHLNSTDLSAWPGLGTPKKILRQLRNTDEPMLDTLALPKREHGVRTVYATIAPRLVLQIGQSLEDDDELIEAFLHGFLFALAAVIALGGPIGWFMARRALRGVDEVTAAAAEIADGALDRRVSVRSRGDELDRMAQTFNRMLDRIQALIVGMREMTDNLAHDLRSPIARIRAAAEIALAGGESKEEWKSLAANMTGECDRLLEMINVTLDIAEAESGAAKLKNADIDLVKVVLDACELFQTVAEDRQITIATDLPEHCPIQGDLQRLQRVTANLLDNALKYSTAGGKVSISLIDENRLVKLSVEDRGIGIPTDELSRVFERFYRCDPSRSTKGNGLGLSLALAFVRAHGGDIGVRSAPGQGTTFTVVLYRSGAGRWWHKDCDDRHSVSSSPL